ncbi:sugar phosphate isomerase/epimerase [Enterococcus sp. 669A]|uniref:Sugar phosphate isomerase/epimerase n=1 Tax=Candidatus Enterococcus moelleringii TaxID=2815325 RepID=A0ABS3L550_9ENTE|nr:sugar phosphate isomerase/epimerase family protein [Enterococcus sp. 669A]MBO1304739.1 sugar phosphate isomerase/epimerase [Enterococcus sp. 669A]
MKKGMNVWSLPSDLSLEEQFRVTKEAGFDTIELNVTEAEISETIVSKDLALAEKLDLTLEASEDDLANIKRLSEKYQLPIESLSTALHWKYPLNAEKESDREKGKYIVKKMIDFCQYLGGDTILVVPGVVSAGRPYDECYSFAKSALEELAPYAQERQVVIGIENVWNKFLLSPLEMRQLIDEIDSPYVGAYFDVGNILQYGFPEQWISILGKRIAKIHVKDFKTSIGSIQGFTNLLQGNVDWQAVVTALNDIGYKGPLTCELSPYTTNGKQLATDTSAALEYITKL